ncbi:MAG: hypothetical protein AB1529_03395 [Candidatus Micrarchaeota archaeon]
MESKRNQRVLSVALGLGMVITGSYFVVPLAIASYLIGLMLVGFGMEPRMQDDSPPSAPKPPMMSKSAKRTRRKK